MDTPKPNDRPNQIKGIALSGGTTLNANTGTTVTVTSTNGEDATGVLADGNATINLTGTTLAVQSQADVPNGRAYFSMLTDLLVRIAGFFAFK